MKAQENRRAPTPMPSGPNLEQLRSPSDLDFLTSGIWLPGLVRGRTELVGRSLWP